MVGESPVPQEYAELDWVTRDGMKPVPWRLIWTWLDIAQSDLVAVLLQLERDKNCLHPLPANTEVVLSAGV